MYNEQSIENQAQDNTPMSLWPMCYRLGTRKAQVLGVKTSMVLLLETIH